MPRDDNEKKTSLQNNALNRRKVLLGGTTLAAASAITSTNPIRVAQAQPAPRHEIFYFTEGTLSAVRVNDFKYRFTDQPNGWLGATEKVDWPILTNLRLDPYERTGMYNGKDNGSINYYNWFAYEF
jgi:hypothetical protein